MKKMIFLVLLLTFTLVPVMAQDNYIFGDPLPTAPELALRGEYSVGVQTLTLVKADSVDLLSLSADNPTATYDRVITIEVWYPAIIPDGVEERTTYDETLGRADVEGSLRAFTFEGRALRDAEPNTDGASYPLVIVSHGFPGSRYMMTYLTENLASKGYVVVAIDHTESTFSDVSNFGSTLFNRSTDQRFVIDEMDALSAGDGFLGGLLDAQNTAVIGYSMGGYGALATIGAGYNQVLTNFLGAVAEPLIYTEDYEADARVKASVLFAPWGGDLTPVGAPGASFWNADALANINIPTLWVSGSHDDVALYSGTVNLFESAVNSERYLLTYDNALHNSAPNPPPVEAVELGDYQRYADPVWDERRINNVNQHFVTAFLDQYLKGHDNDAYLKPAVENSNEGIFSLDEDGVPTADHTYWMGFPPRTALGLSLRFMGAE